MKIGIICGGDREIAPFLSSIENSKVTEKAMLKIYEGTLGGMQVAALFSGVCKVNAAIAAQILIDCYQVDAIINAGTAGGMNPSLQIFDTVISTEVAYHDVAPHILTGFHPWLKSIFFSADQKLLCLTKKISEKIKTDGKILFGRMVTGEAFITDEGREEINRQYAPMTVDMESASIAHVCHVNKIPFLSIRTVTDTASHSGIEHFEENCTKAAQIAKDITTALLNEIADEYRS